MPEAAPWCFKLSFAWYVNALFNLNPFLALDGYYLVMDWLEVPNLRARGLSWVVARLRRRPPLWRTLDREGRLIALYGMLAVGWLLIAVNIGYRVYVDRVGGLNDVCADIAMMRTPDGHSRVELTKFHTPPAVRAEPESAPANTLGIRRIMFAVDDIDDVVARLRSHGAELVGEIAQYEDIYRLCFLRGPEGIIIGLAEQLSNKSVTDVLGNP